MRFSVPALQFYPLPVYSLFPQNGGPQYNSGSVINPNEGFVIQTDQKFGFTPSYSVNIPPAINPLSNTDYFRFQAGQGGRQADFFKDTPIANAPKFTTPLAFSGGSSKTFGTGDTPSASIHATTIPTVIPNLPTKYLDYLRSTTVSDLNFNTLINQPTFNITNVGMGLQVVTDGAGHIVSEHIQPSPQGINRDMGSPDQTFFLTNREQILLRATLQAAQTTGQVEPSEETSPNQNSQAVFAQDIFAKGGNGATALFGLADTLATQKLSLQNFLKDSKQLNPVLERLLQLQPPNLGLPVSGFNAGVNGDTSRQLAASQSGFDVTTGSDFQDNIARLTQSTVGQPIPAEELLGALPPEAIPLTMQQIMDGRIPTAPFLPASPTIQAQVSSYGSDLSAASALEDVLSRKSKGGYIPFAPFSLATGTGTTSAGGQGASTQGGNPFQQQFTPFDLQSGLGRFGTGSGSQQQSQQRQQNPFRRRLAFSA